MTQYIFTTVIFSTFFIAGGCGPIIYTANISDAASSIAQARAANAASDAPYEFYSAQSYLEKAHEEAGDASYQDAISYARVAECYAAQAQTLVIQRNAQ